MKLFLTSNGLSNETLKKEFIQFVEKAPTDIKIAFIPTAANCLDCDKGWLIENLNDIKSIGAYVDIVDISTLSKENWFPRLEKADVLFFGGGDTLYLFEQVKKAELDKHLLKLLETKVYAGISAGSMITNPSLYLSSKDGGLYEEEKAFSEGDKALSYTNFYFRPHFLSQDFPYVNFENLNATYEKYKKTIYGVDDASAVLVDGEKVKVISEGNNWRQFG